MAGFENTRVLGEYHKQLNKSMKVLDEKNRSSRIFNIADRVNMTDRQTINNENDQNSFQSLNSTINQIQYRRKYWHNDKEQQYNDKQQQQQNVCDELRKINREIKKAKVQNSILLQKFYKKVNGFNNYVNIFDSVLDVELNRNENMLTMISKGGRTKSMNKSRSSNRLGRKQLPELKNNLEMRNKYQKQQEMIKNKFEMTRSQVNNLLMFSRGSERVSSQTGLQRQDSKSEMKFDIFDRLNFGNLKSLLENNQHVIDEMKCMNRMKQKNLMQLVSKFKLQLNNQEIHT